MSEGPNWVERRFAIDSSLQKNAPRLWEDIRSAIQDACGNFVARYGTSKATTVEILPENGRRLRIVAITYGGEAPRILVVFFDSGTKEIKWTVDDGAGAFKISANEKEAFIFEDGKLLNPDDISRRILEPFLFGKS